MHMKKGARIEKILNVVLAGDILFTIICSGCFYAVFFHGFLKHYPKMEAIIYLRGIIVLLVSLLLLVSFVACCIAKIRVWKISLVVALLAPIIVLIEMFFMVLSQV